MNILTPDGYKPIEKIQIGDKVVAFDVFTGEKIENEVLDKTFWDSEVPEFTGKFYRINNTWDLFEEQSVWRNNNVVFHAKSLEIGDIIFDENDQDVKIISIEEVTHESWWKLHISGDASYISDGLTLHNASRFWVGGTGTWTSIDTSKWSATTGGASGSSVPGSADLATFDANSGGGTVTLNYAPTIGGMTGGAHTGTFDTGNNNITFSTGTRLDWSGTGVRTLNLGSSTLNCVGQSGGGWNIATTTNLTFNCGTSTISNAIGANSTFNGGSLIYYNVTTSAIGGGAGNITGSNTFNNLTLNGVGNASRVLIEFNTTQTVNGTFTVNGTSSTVFGAIGVRGTGSNFYAGITTTINAANVSLNNIILIGINATGAATWSGTNLGNGGGCTGITFTTPVTRYWRGGTGSFAATTNWSISSGGSGGASVPLPQDTVIFDANSVTTTSQTITFNHSVYPSIDFSGLLNNPTISFSMTNGGLYFLGDFKIGSNVTSAGINGLFFQGYGTQYVDFTGHTLASTAATQITFVGTNVIFNGNFTGSSTGTLQHIAGDVNFNNYNVTCGVMSQTTSAITRTLTMGNGIITVTSTGTVWSFGTTTGLTIVPNSSTIVINNATISSKTFAGGSKTYNNITFSGDNIIVTGSNTFNAFAVNNAGLTTGLSLTNNTTTTISSMTTNGTANSLSKIMSTLAGSAATLRMTSGTVSLNYISIKDSTATGGATFYAGYASINVSGNTGWLFYNAPFTGQAYRDENRIATLLATNSRDGSNVVPIYATPSIARVGSMSSSAVTRINRLVVSDGTTGSDLGPINAKRDGNYVPTLVAVSSADGVTPVVVYGDNNINALLVKST